MSDKHIPTLYEWAGGNTTIFENLMEVFYDQAVADELLKPLFEGMSADHRRHVALWFVEVFGGPKAYSTEHGGHAAMVRKHLNLAITEPQRARWMQLIGLAADQVGLRNDPEFRSAFVGYAEWGTRMALMYSQSGQTAPSDASPMPKWGWGEVQPYMPDSE